MLHSLHLLSREGLVLLAHYFVDATVEEQDAWEVALAGTAPRPWEVAAAAGGGADACSMCERRPLVVRLVRDVVFVMAGAPGEDELGVAEALELAARLVDAACDRALSAARVVEFHGKLVVCLHEMFTSGGGGHVRYGDVDTVLRNAKLKAPPA